MRILNVICSVDPAGGGVFEAARSFAIELARRGHAIEFVCLDAPDDACVQAFPLPIQALGPGGPGYRYTPKLRRWIIENRSRFEIAIVHSLWNHASIGGRAGLVAAGIPYLYFTHGMLDVYFNTVQPTKKWAKQLFWLLFQGRVLKDAHRVLFTTVAEQEASRSTFKGFGRYRSEIVSLGIEGVPLNFTGASSDFDDLRVATARPYLLFLSRVHPKKGVDLLIDAYIRHGQMQTAYDLVIAGPDPGNLRSMLMQGMEPQVADKIHWIGMVTGARKWKLMIGARACVLPSHQENFGIVVAEAMSCSVPVLTTDKVNVHPLITASGGGLIEPDTPEGVYRLLDRFCRITDAELKKMRRAARDCFISEFSVAAATDRFERLLGQVVDSAERNT